MKRESAVSLSPVEEIIAEIRAGSIVVLVDDEDRENEGDLVIPAQFATPDAINFMARHARGLICLTLTEERCRQLALPLMVAENRATHGTNFTVSIEAAEGIATGISAHDRALTIRVAAAATATASDIVQPGHVFPLVAQDGGVLVRAGHTEACCDLARLAGLTPAAVLCEIMREDGSMARLPDLMQFAAEHGLKIGTIADLIEHRSRNESMVQRIAGAAAAREIDTAWGRFRLIAYRDLPSGATHLALTLGEIRRDRDTLVRVHEPLSVVDLLDAGPGSHSWGVGETLAEIRRAGAGVMVLLNCSQSDDALQAQLAGSPPARNGRSMDLRTYGIGAQILRDLGVGRMRVLARPKRIPSMAGFGLEVVEYLSPEDVARVKVV